MTSIAKFLVGCIAAAAITANAVSAAHGWAHVDWVPVGIAWAGALGVYAYPNLSRSAGGAAVPTPPVTPPAPPAPPTEIPGLG